MQDLTSIQTPLQFLVRFYFCFFNLPRPLIKRKISSDQLRFVCPRKRIRPVGHWTEPSQLKSVYRFLISFFIIYFPFYSAPSRIITMFLKSERYFYLFHKCWSLHLFHQILFSKVWQLRKFLKVFVELLSRSSSYLRRNKKHCIL